MTKPEISIIVPSIRPHNLERFYNSIFTSTKRSFELIVIGPYDLPQSLQQHKNIKYVRDFGSSSRCSNIGFLLSEGEIITDSADDAVYYPNVLDESIDILYALGDDYKNVVLHQYLEGKDGTNKIHQPESYYNINNATQTRSPYIPDHWKVFNSFVMHRKFVEELGFLNCQYINTALSHIEYGIRAYVMGANVKLCPNKIIDVDHDQPDHSFVEHSQIGLDEPLFQRTFRDPNWMNNIQICVDVNNWKEQETVWMRFK